MLTVESDAQWQALVERLDDARLRDLSGAKASERQTAHDSIDAVLSDWALGRGTDEAARALQECGIPASGVLDAAEILALAQSEARGYWQWLEQPHLGNQPHPTTPARTIDGPPLIDRPSPTLGQHTAEVLQGLLGVSAAEIEALEREGVIGTMPVPPDRP